MRVLLDIIAICDTFWGDLASLLLATLLSLRTRTVTLVCAWLAFVTVNKHGLAVIDTSLCYCEEVVGGVLVRLYEVGSSLGRCFALLGARLNEARVLGLRQLVCVLPWERETAYDVLSLLLSQLGQGVMELSDV